MILFKVKYFFKRIKNKISKTKIFAVYENDMEKLLTDMSLLDKINSKSLSCKNCGKIINVNNIGGILSINKNIEIICDRSICLSNFDTGCKND
ncbi:hypothetical protein H8E88_03715 [candidate division KSB1 bacterium]|nr:hypothetical protein [candidate division KSB1 bacterium]